MRYFSKRHPAHRFSDDIKDSIRKAQENTLPQAYSDAFSFCEQVVDTVGVRLVPPCDFKEKAAAEIADLNLSELRSLFGSLLLSGGYSKSVCQVHSDSLAKHVQLVSAFEDHEAAIDLATEKALGVIKDIPRARADIEVGKNAGDVLDPYLLTGFNTLLGGGRFVRAIDTTVVHKSYMKIEGLMGHLHEDVISLMRGNVRAPEPRGVGAKELCVKGNPFPGADIVQPPQFDGDYFKLHQIKTKTGTMNSSGGKSLAVQMGALKSKYPRSEVYAHALVGKTLKGHRSKSTILETCPSMILQVGEASFKTLSGSWSGGECLLTLYQMAFDRAREQADFNFDEAVEAISRDFEVVAEAEGSGYLESVLHKSTCGNRLQMDSRTYSPKASN